MHQLLNIHAKPHYTDIEVVRGLQTRQRHIEEWFYENAKRYFTDKFHKVFFDEQQKATVFQDSFVKLWTQIEDKEILVMDEKVCRHQNNGGIRPMTCSLNTFLFAIAKNEYRELVRNTKEEMSVEEIYVNDNNQYMPYLPGEEDIHEVQLRIVDRCIQQMSPHCLEILTLFYIKGKTLDEIMEIRHENNSSKVGLKTAKYKCMNHLRNKVTEMCNSLNIKI